MRKVLLAVAVLAALLASTPAFANCSQLVIDQGAGRLQICRVCTDSRGNTTVYCV